MAKKDVSLIESGAGLFQGFITGLMDIVREANAPFEAIYRLAKPEGRKTLEKMVDVAVGDYQVSITPPVPEPTIVELDLWLDDNLDFDAGKALGEYDDANSDATAERFPSENSGRGKRMVKVKLVCFHRPLYDEEGDSEVDREIGKLSIGKRGGTQVILAVGAQYKEQQRTKYIVGSAFWSRPDGDRGFLCLRSHVVKRFLGLSWFYQGRQWYGGTWFVVVPQE